MEMLIAMLCGAVGGVVVAGVARRKTLGRWSATLVGILGGAGAWQVLAMIGPGDVAGPLVIWHAAGGAIGGGLLVALAAMLRMRLSR